MSEQPQSERERASSTGRVIDAALELLDHQIEDRERRPIGKVDDVAVIEIDGTRYVDALLVGVSALATRIDGRVGAAMSAIHRRLHPDADPHPRRVPWSAVSNVGSSIQIARDELELAPNLLERWVAEQIIDRIPGASHRPSVEDPKPDDHGPVTQLPQVRSAPDERESVGALLNRVVVDVDGTPVGKVVDVRFVLDGPLDGVFARPRLHGLLVGRGGAFARMGYDREDLSRPWVLEQLFGRLHARLRFVAWPDVDRLDAARRSITLRIGAAALASSGDPR